MKTLEQVKNEHFMKAFVKYKGNHAKIATALDISKRSVFNWIKRLEKLGLIELR